jgi:hypothetical protein
LRPEVHHLLTPSYSLAGPYLRPLLRIAFGDSGVALRLGPELIVVTHVGEDLRDEGVSGSALGLGGEARLEIEIEEHLGLHISYREAHALLEASRGEAGDIERYVTLRFVGSL